MRVRRSILLVTQPPGKRKPPPGVAVALCASPFNPTLPGWVF
jgi:hypothetical protein